MIRSPRGVVDQKSQGQIGLKFVQKVVFQQYFSMYEGLERKCTILKILKIENESFMLLTSESYI